MNMKENNNVVRLDEGVWSIEEPLVRAFLVTGREKALLIDTGMNNRTISYKVGKLTDLPVSVVNTHCDVDHVGGNSQFGTVYIHPDDMEEAKADKKNAKVKYIPVKEGFVFDLGDRKLEVLDTPGHTPGSIMLFDRGNRMLFSGDTISENHIYMKRSNCSFEMIAGSLRKILDMKNEIDVIFPSHGRCPLDNSYVEDILKCAEAYSNGTLKKEKFEYTSSTGPMQGNISRLGRASFLLP